MARMCGTFLSYKSLPSSADRSATYRPPKRRIWCKLCSHVISGKHMFDNSERLLAVPRAPQTWGFDLEEGVTIPFGLLLDNRLYQRR